MLYDLYIYKSMKNIFLLILRKSEKKGGGEKPSDVRKPGVLYPSSLFCIFSPMLPACEGEIAYSCSTGVLTGCCGLGDRAGMDYSCPVVQRGH